MTDRILTNPDDFITPIEYETLQVNDNKSKLQSLIESQERHIERLESFISTLKEENERLRIDLTRLPPHITYDPQMGSITGNPNSGIQTPSQLRSELERKLREKALIKKEESVQ